MSADAADEKKNIWAGAQHFLQFGWADNPSIKFTRVYRGSYMSAHVPLNLLNELGQKIRCEAFPNISSDFPDEFNAELF